MVRPASFTVALIVALLIVIRPLADAEDYIGGQIGVALPQSFSNANLIGPPGFGGGSSIPDLDLTNSLMYGAKLGHYSEELPWFGIEGEVFRTTPHITQQAIPPFQGITSVGGTMGVTTMAFNAVARYRAARLQPYAGVGPGLFFAQLKSGELGEAQSASLGLNTQLGLRYMLTEHVGMFAEWKYNLTRMSFDALPNATYQVHFLAFGLSYHFASPRVDVSRVDRTPPDTRR